MRWVVVLLAASLAAYGFMAWSPSGSPNEVRRIPVESKEWVSEMRDGSIITFTRSDAGTTPDPAGPASRRANDSSDLVTLGHLPPEQIPALVKSLGVEASSRAVAKAATKAESGRVRDYSDFLFERYVHEKVLTAERMAREGAYVTVPRNSQFPVLPDGYHILAQLNAGSVNGQRVDVLFLIDSADPRNAAVMQSANDMDTFDGYQTDQEVLAFNSKP